MTVTISGTTGIDKVQDGTIVQADLAANVVGNGPAFKCFRAAAYTINDGAYQIVADTSEVSFGITLSSGQVKPNVAGYYQVNAVIAMTGAGDYYNCSIYKNNALEISGVLAGKSNYPVSTASGLVYLNGTTDFLTYVVSVTGQSVAGTLSNSRAGNYISGFLARAA